MIGRITAVVERYLGSHLAVGLSGGETTVTLHDTADFDETGTIVFVDNGDTSAYTAINETTGVLTLSGTVAAAHTVEDTEVRIYPEAVERWATIKVGDNSADEEGVLARVPHALYDRIAVGVRDLEAGEGETVTAAYLSDQLVITELQGKAPFVDGTYIDPTTISTGSDGIAPTSSPTAVVHDAIGALAVTWDPIVNADIVTYDLYIDTVTNPSSSGGNYVTSVVGGNSVFLRVDGSGAALVAGTTYYVQIIANDADGSATAGTEGSGAPIGTGGSDGVAPTTSPTAVVSSGTGFLYVKWTATTNADPVTYDVYIGTSANPSTSGGNLVTSTPALAAVLTKDAAGASLSTATTYHVQLISRDADGSAAAGTEGTGSPSPDVGATDGNVPSTSPAIDHILAGYSFFNLVWSPISNADPVAYEVHVGTSSGFTPGSGTLALDTFATSAVVKHLPSGSAFAYGTTYYFVLLAKDDDGPCATYGAQSSSTLAKIDGTGDISANSITAASITAGTITASEIAAATITASNIATGTITATQIAANTITAAKIAAGTITATEISANTITAAKIASGTITATEIAAATITGAKIAAATITASNMVVGTITAASGIINDLTVDKLTTGTMSATVTLSGSIKTASSGQRVEITSTGITGYDGGSTDWGAGAGVTSSIPTSGTPFFYGSVVADVFTMYVPALTSTAGGAHSHVAWLRSSDHTKKLAAMGTYSTPGDVVVSFETHVYSGDDIYNSGTWSLVLQDADTNSGGHAKSTLDFIIQPVSQFARTAYFTTGYYPVGSNVESNPFSPGGLTLFYVDNEGNTLGSSLKGGTLSSFLAFGRAHGDNPGSVNTGQFGRLYAATLNSYANYDGDRATYLSLARGPVIEELYNQEDGTWGLDSKMILIPALGSAVGQTFSIYDDFLGAASLGLSTGFSTGTSGAGTGATDTTSIANHPGIWTITTGSTSSGVTNLRCSSVLLGNGRFRMGGIVRIPTASSGTQRFVAGVGISQGGTTAVTTPVHGLTLRYSDNINSGKWQAVAADSAGGSPNTADTGVTMTAGNWYFLEVEVNAAASSATYYINGVSKATLSANIDTTALPAAFAAIEKSIGTTARTLDVDALYAYGVSTTHRWT